MNGQMMELLVFFYGIGNVSVQNTRLKVLFFPFPLFYHPMFYSYQSFSALPLMAAKEEIPLNEVVISGKEQIYRLQMQFHNLQVTWGVRVGQGYQIRGERIVFWWPNRNRNIIRFPKNGRIQILFSFPKMIKYEYEYYLVFQKQPNTNMNIIRLPRNDQIEIWI